MKYFIGLFLFLLIFSCDPYVSEIELPDESQRIVINSFFPGDSTWKIGITRARPLSFVNPNKGYGELFDDIENATVTLKENSNIIGTPKYKESSQNWGWKNGFYRSAETATPGNTYQIEVSAPGYPTAVATCKIPVAVPLVSAEALSEELDDNSRIPVMIKFREQPGIENYYEIFIVHRYISYHPQTGEPVILNNYDAGTHALTQDQLFNQRIEPFDFSNPVPSEEPVLFSDKGMDGQDLSILAKVATYPHWEALYPKTERWIILRTLSKEYFENIYTKALAGRVNSDPFSQPVQIFSNVSGGHGIFAGYSVSSIELH
jgi:hypothetical protein